VFCRSLIGFISLFTFLEHRQDTQRHARRACRKGGGKHTTKLKHRHTSKQNPKQVHTLHVSVYMCVCVHNVRARERFCVCVRESEHIFCMLGMCVGVYICICIYIYICIYISIYIYIYIYIYINIYPYICVYILICR